MIMNVAVITIGGELSAVSCDSFFTYTMVLGLWKLTL